MKPPTSAAEVLAMLDSPEDTGTHNNDASRASTDKQDDASIAVTTYAPTDASLVAQLTSALQVGC